MNAQSHPSGWFSAPGMGPREGDVGLLDLRSGQPGAATSLEFLADGHTLQIATEVGEVYRWDTRLSHWIDFACRAAGRNLTQ